MPMIIDRRFTEMTEGELRSAARRLFDLWALKGHMPVEKMPVWWRREVGKIKLELERRGVQLTLF